MATFIVPDRVLWEREGLETAAKDTCDMATPQLSQPHVCRGWCANVICGNAYSLRSVLFQMSCGLN